MDHVPPSFRNNDCGMSTTWSRICQKLDAPASVATNDTAKINDSLYFFPRDFRRSGTCSNISNRLEMSHSRSSPAGVEGGHPHRRHAEDDPAR